MHTILRQLRWYAEWGRIIYLLEIFSSPHFRGRISTVLPLHINIVHWRKRFFSGNGPVIIILLFCFFFYLPVTFMPAVAYKAKWDKLFCEWNWDTRTALMLLSPCHLWSQYQESSYNHIYINIHQQLLDFLYRNKIIQANSFKVHS